MTAIARRSPIVAPAALLALICWTSAAAWAQGAIDKIANDDSIFVDGYTFQVRPGRAKGAAAGQIKNLNARELGPAAIVFRSGDKLYVASAPVRLPSNDASANGGVYVTAQEIPAGRIRIEYVPPKNADLQKVYDMVNERHTLEMVQMIFSPVRLPVDLAIKTVECNGVSNAWYQRDGKVPTVSVCYEYLQEIWRSMPQDTPAGALLTMSDAICGQLFFAVAHELGHAMFDIFDVPLFGRQEDAADQFATFIMLQFGGERARKLISGAAYGYHEYIKDLKDKPKVTLPLAAFSSDHGTPEERFFNLLCTAYGYDATLFADLVKERLPESRAAKCKFEYDDLRFAFRQVFSAHLDYDKVKKVLETDWFADIQRTAER